MTGTAEVPFACTATHESTNSSVLGTPTSNNKVVPAPRSLEGDGENMAVQTYGLKHSGKLNDDLNDARTIWPIEHHFWPRKATID